MLKRLLFSVAVLLFSTAANAVVCEMDGAVHADGDDDSVLDTGEIVYADELSTCLLSNKLGVGQVDFTGIFTATNYTPADLSDTGLSIREHLNGIDNVLPSYLLSTNLNSLAELDSQIGITGVASATTYWRGDNSWTTPAGAGDVVGPASATDNAITRYDLTTGKLLQTSLCTISDLGAISCPDIDGDNLINLFDNGTGTTTCAAKGAAGRLTIIDSDGSGTASWKVCDGTSDLFVFADPLALLTAGRSLTKSTNTVVVDAPIYTHSCDFALEAPLTGDDGDVQCYFPNAATLTRVYCSTDTGTSVINLYERAEATPNTGTTDMLTADLTCDTDGQATTTFTDAAVAADGLLALSLQTTFTSGWVRVHAEFTVND